MCAPLSFTKENGRRSVLWFVAAVVGTLVIGGLLWIPSTGDTSSAKPESPQGIPIGGVAAWSASEEKEFVKSPLEMEAVDTPEFSPQEDEPIDPLLTPPALEFQPGKLPWEVQIDALLASHLSDSDKARWLLAQLPLMPIEACSRLAQEAADRIPDRDYTAIALPVLLNTNTDGSSEAVLYADLLERPDPIALPALLALARNPRHSFAETARETLALLIGADFGTDWKRWESAVAGLLLNSQ